MLIMDNCNITLYDPLQIKSARDLHNYKKGLKTSKLFKQFHDIVQHEELTGDQPRERSIDSINDNKSYVESQYQRNMIRKSGVRAIQRPSYLSNFKFVKEPNIEDTLLAVKKGAYNLEKEDMQLNEIIKDLATNPKNA